MVMNITSTIPTLVEYMAYEYMSNNQEITSTYKMVNCKSTMKAINRALRQKITGNLLSMALFPEDGNAVSRQ